MKWEYGYVSLLEKAMAQRRALDIQQAKDAFALRLVAIRNMQIPREMPMYLDLLAIEFLFDCVFRQTRGSSIETVHEAAVAGSFLFWPLLITRLF